MGRRKSAKSRGLLYALAGAGIVIIGVLIASYVGLYAIAPTPSTTAADQTATFTAYYLNGTAISEDDYDIQGYLYSYEDASDLTASEIDDLRFADFSLEDSGDLDTIEVDLSEDKLYALLINCSGLQPWWALSYAPDFDDALYTLIVPGENQITLAKTPTTVSVLAYNSTLGTTLSIVDSTTQQAVYNNTDEDWTVVVRALDADGETDSGVGFKPYFDFANWAQNETCVAFEFNATLTSDITTSVVDITNFDEDERVQNQIAYEGIRESWTGDLEVDVDIDWPSNCRLTDVLVYFEPVGSDIVALATL